MAKGLEHFFTNAHRISCQDMTWDPKDHKVWTKRVDKMKCALEEDMDNWEHLGEVKAASSEQMEVDKVPPPVDSIDHIIFSSGSVDEDDRTCPSIRKIREDKAHSKPSKKVLSTALNPN